MRKYRALRSIGMDCVAAALVAAISAAVQPPNVIRILNVEIEL